MLLFQYFLQNNLIIKDLKGPPWVNHLLVQKKPSELKKIRVILCSLIDCSFIDTGAPPPVKVVFRIAVNFRIAL